VLSLACPGNGWADYRTLPIESALRTPGPESGITDRAPRVLKLGEGSPIVAVSLRLRPSKPIRVPIDLAPGRNRTAGRRHQAGADPPVHRPRAAAKRRSAASAKSCRDPQPGQAGDGQRQGVRRVLRSLPHFRDGACTQHESQVAAGAGRLRPRSSGQLPSSGHRGRVKPPTDQDLAWTLTEDRKEPPLITADGSNAPTHPSADASARRSAGPRRAGAGDRRASADGRRVPVVPRETPAGRGRWPPACSASTNRNGACRRRWSEHLLSVQIKP